MDNKQQTPLVGEMIEITGVELVEKGKAPNTWKEYAVKVKDYVKGTHYSIPIKKATGEFTKAYEYFKENKSKWEEAFVEDNTIKVKVGVSVKTRDWTHEGNTGTSTYKTIRFMEELSDVDEALIEKDEVVNVEEIPFD